MNLKITFLFLAVFIFTLGCGSQSGFHAEQIPTEMTRPEDLEGAPFVDNDGDEIPFEIESEINNFEGQTADENIPEKGAPPGATEKSAEQPSHDSTKPKVALPQQRSENAKKGLPLPTTPSKPNLWKSMIDMARWVIKHESQQVGKACNFFIQRVFEMLGFGKASWLANDFDRYVKANFRIFKLVTFSQSSSSSEQKKLRKYLWDAPERTGFIFQWKRKGRHGHIAFVQRIGDKLVIYHASLNRFNPKAQLATVETLLNKTGQNNLLQVFSHFQK